MNENYKHPQGFFYFIFSEVTTNGKMGHYSKMQSNFFTKIFCKINLRFSREMT